MMLLHAGILSAKPPSAGEPVVAYARAGFSSDTSTPSGTPTNLSWTEEILDSGWGFSTPVTTFTVPSGVTFVVVSCNFFSNAFTGFDDTTVWIRRNSTDLTDRRIENGGWIACPVRMGFAVVAGDTIAIRMARNTIDTFEADAEFCFVSIVGY